MSGRSNDSGMNDARQQQSYPGLAQQRQQQQGGGGPPYAGSSQQQQQFTGVPMAAAPETTPQQQRLLQIQQQELQLQQIQRQQQQQRASLYQQQQQSQQRRPSGQLASPGTQRPTVSLSQAALEKNTLGNGSSSLVAPSLAIPPPSPSTTTKNRSSPTIAAAALSTSKPGGGSKATSAPKAMSRQSSASAVTAGPTDEETVRLLRQCDWTDRTLWISRQILGGQSVNVFLRATATVQRIKKQRARQAAQAKAKAEDGTASVASSTITNNNSKKRGQEITDQATEEALKKEVMNARTAKKIKAELEVGLNFCALIHGTIRSILQEMDPSLQPPPPLGPELPNPNAARIPPSQLVPPALVAKTAPSPASTPTKTSKSPAPQPPMQRATSTASQSSIASATSSTGAAQGSMLRKHRKKKLRPSNEPPVELSEFDQNGKRIFTKKEHTYRIFEVIRFRPLRQGDFVAARVTSRDLWILARVLRDYPGHNLPPLDFLALSEAKRDQLFREKVLIKDVEDKSEGGTLVARSLVLPLSRSFSEAAEWGQRYKKGSRVYAMYPHTTSLYTATVIDNTTYCRDDDDVIVVEFDGDDPDPTGATPKHHIPARFVTLIPREFPGSQPESKSSNKTTKRRASQSSTASAPAPAPAPAATMDPLDNMLMFDQLDGLDDLEFDLLGGT